MSSDQGFDYIETDGGQEKVQYTTVLMVSIMRINDIMNRINETPHELHKLAVNLEDDDLKPNRLNFMSAVDGLELTFSPYIKPHLQEEIDNNNTQPDTVMQAKKRFRVLMKAIHSKGLLPLEIAG